ncbi:MAG: Ldh family oxidoreductase [Planctomycetota bacterium]|jgi:L-lactate dehydrogenase
MPKVSFENLVDFGARLLEKHGMAAEDARFIAETAATTEACGVHTHGAVLLAAIDRGVGSGIDAAAEPEVVNERGATALIDGKRASGGQCMRLAVQIARRKAAESGCAVVAARNTSWIGGLGGWILPLAREGLFAQVLAQSSQCQDSAPTGGIDPCFSTNPIAMAFPTDADPVLADFSTAVMSMGKVNTLKRAGRKAPQPVFFTKEGELTDDPQAMIDGGSMLTAGGDVDGHKGYALTLWIEGLTAMAGGSCNNPDEPQRQCFTLMVIDPKAFGDADHYHAELKRFTSRVRSGRRRPGVDAIRLPGERAQKQLAESMKTGVELRDELFENFAEIAAERGIEPLKALG